MKLRVKNPLQPLSLRSWLLILLSLEALIFLLDMATGASISYAPFLCVPTALSAWYLNRRATLAFVILSSMARVYDFHLFRFRHETPLMLLYELLQSALLFGIVAAIIFNIRGMVERLVLHANKIRRSARTERHRKLMQSSIRRAIPEDVDAIIALTALGKQRGGFDKDVSSAVNQAALAANFKQGIIEGAAMRDVWNGGMSTVPIEFWVSSINGHVAGYLMILGLNEQKGAERELHAMVVGDAYRGLGVGSALTDFFCSHYQQRRLFVGCKPGSIMMDMVLRRGFKLYATTNGEYQIVARG